LDVNTCTVLQTLNIKILNTKIEETLFRAVNASLIKKHAH